MHLTPLATTSPPQQSAPPKGPKPGKHFIPLSYLNLYCLDSWLINLDLIICVDSVAKKIEREVELRDSTTSENRRRDWKKKKKESKARKVDSDLTPSLIFLFLIYIYIYIIINGG